MANVLNPENVPLDKVPTGYRFKTDEDLSTDKVYSAWYGARLGFSAPNSCYGVSEDKTYIIAIEQPDPAQVLVLPKTESVYHSALQEVYFLVQDHEKMNFTANSRELAANILTKIRHLV